MPDTFELETRDGIRRVEFDPDAFRHRDVRILVDGDRVAEMPFPKPTSPYGEVSFLLGEHTLVAVAHLSTEPTQVESFGLRYDLFANGRSLTDGSLLKEARSRAPALGEAYPGQFQVIDMVLRVVPAASAPGMAIAFTRRADEWGWPMVIASLAVILGVIVLATMVAGRAWTRIRGDATRSLSRRAALGWAVVLGCYAVAGACLFLLAGAIGTVAAEPYLTSWASALSVFQHAKRQGEH